MDKEDLKELLKQFSQEEIREALGEQKKNNRRRGKGKRKKRANQNIQKTVNKFDDIISTIRLSPEESQELKEAEAADKGAQVNPNRGRRGQAKKQSFRCSSCGKDFDMFPSQVYSRERWKCNKCIVSGK